MDRNRGSGHGLAAEECRSLGAVSRWPLALVQRARLRLGKRRNVGLAAVSLWPLDAARRVGLGVGAVFELRIQARRSLLDARRASGWLGSAGAWRGVVVLQYARAIRGRQLDVRGF